MTKVIPGSVGWSVTGDRSIEFAKQPIDFIERRIKQHDSKIFIARALNVPTVFVCSNEGVRQIFENEDYFAMGYKDFGYIYQLYGDVLLFYDDAEAMRLRGIIRMLFDHAICQHYVEQVRSITTEFLSDFDKSNHIQLYETFKSFTTALSLELFLGLNWKSKAMEYETIKSISTIHWHGLISVPLNVRLRGWSSSFSKAIEAKEYLMRFIRKRLRNSTLTKRDDKDFIANANQADFKDEDEALMHVLLFISALIPKALASLLTSFCIATSGADKAFLRARMRGDDEYLSDVLLEVQRLWPPFLGGRRIARKDVVIDGHTIPANTAVAYINWFANRDPKTFSSPNNFNPERWQTCDQLKRDLVWTFGGGKRICVGVDFINNILKIICKKLLADFDWTLANHTSHEVPYKTLPVARPRHTVLASFVKRR
ncbi:uncharacterized protein LOC135696415 [Rhopilema esculentum]|uniref:uncharacterized protein LOC135696415 n=1 Tax=Rhopilema esculentum TaxID=499914 RepID=UPI0031E0EF40